MKQLVIRSFFWVSLVMGFLLLALVSYGFYLVSDLNKKGSFSLNSISQGREINMEKVSLELGSLVKKEDLRFIYPFLAHSEFLPKTFNQWFEDASSNRSLAPLVELNLPGHFMVNQPMDFSIERINDCERVYCYQRRVNFADIPSSLWRGLIGIEDERFLEHSGVDLKALARAAIADLKALSFIQGGSTLTQQLVKNLFFTNEKTIIRKIKEVLLSLYIENKYEKDEILQAYFNEVVWGSLGGVRIKGVYAASLVYFSKKMSELTDYEASILSALLKGPFYFHPLKNLEKLKERTNLVYDKLKESSFISDEDKSKWNDKRWESWKKSLEYRDKGPRILALTEGLKKRDTFKHYTWGTVALERIRLLKTIDHLKDKDLAVKVQVRDLLTCPDEDECDDFYFYSKFERELDTAIFEEKRQIGSLLKPIVYREIFRNGFEQSHVVSTEPLTLNLKSGPWSPSESSQMDVQYLTLAKALQKSRNIPVIRISEEYGFDKLEEGLVEFLPQMKKPLAQYPAQILGAIELSIGEVTKLYRDFIKKECTDVETDKIGFEDSILSLLSNPNETTLEKVVGPFMGTFRFFGKTGTSNEGHDNWFVSFDGRFLTTIWLGLEGDRVEKSLHLSGAGTSYRIFEAYKMRSAESFNGLSCPRFSSWDQLEDATFED